MLSSSNEDLIHRTSKAKVSTAKRLRSTAARTSERDGSISDASRRKELRRNRRRLRVERNRRIALLLFVWIMVVAALCYLRFRKSTVIENGENVRHRDGKHHHFSLRSAHSPSDTMIGMRYLDPRQLPPLPGEPEEPYKGRGNMGGFHGEGDDAWKADAKSENHPNLGPKVDYTKHKYEYPDLMFDPPNDGSYPPLEQMSSIFETWGQDDIDNPPETLVEVLQHFDYLDPEQLDAAIKYRDLELPFKVYNVPELGEANEKWTDEYVASHFNGNNDDDAPPSRGGCQQSVDNFFAFHRPHLWSEELLGPPPSVDLDWTFDKWAHHAVYADAVSLRVSEKHYYWQSGVPRGERLKQKRFWTFVSRDLPSFSSPKPTFFGFNPTAQKGIQCRFGERGVTAATHYDGGRNMIAMITGAKRYVLSPPNACSKLGIVTARRHPSYRHSMLNFGRVTMLDENDTSSVQMSDREREWLRISAEAPTLSTVLKSGEVLYVPSHWFHYIISLQKSAQCNTRSGVHEFGNKNFGGQADVDECIGSADDEEED